MSITCAALIMALSDPTGGKSYSLGEDCVGSGGRPALVVRTVFAQTVTINAQGKTIRGIFFEGGGNVVVRGGRIEAPLGSGVEALGSGPGHYGVLMNKRSRNVTFEQVTFANARKAIVFGDGSSGLSVRSSRCEGAVEDCLIAAGGSNIDFSNNIVGPFQTKPTQCKVATGTLYTLSRAQCTAQGGLWRDGWHSDVVQLRDGVANVVVADNVINTTGQGLTQMDRTIDAPIRNVRFSRNKILAGRHGLTLDRCENCLIDRNVLKTSMGHLRWKAVIIPGQARACGNVVPSGGPGREKC
jgi:hypothetical protein